MIDFTPTKEELEAAMTGGRPDKVILKDGELLEFVVEEVKNTEKYLIVVSKILSGEHVGKEYPFFITEHPQSRKMLYKMLMTSFTSEEVIGFGASATSKLIGRGYGSKAVVKPRDDGKPGFANFYDFTEVSVGSAPDLAASDIPF